MTRSKVCVAQKFVQRLLNNVLDFAVWVELVQNINMRGFRLNKGTIIGVNIQRWGVQVNPQVLVWLRQWVYGFHVYIYMFVMHDDEERNFKFSIGYW